MALITRCVIAIGLAVVAPVAALAQGRTSVEGFGGLSANMLQAQRSSLGGTVTFEPAPGVQLFGEAGRIGNVLPLTTSTVSSLTRLDLRASAFYGEAGVRFIAAPMAVVSPYGEAAAGLSRLTVTSGRFGPLGNAATSLALGFAGRSAPTAGVGGGVLLRTGPVVFDIGYRYKQLFVNDVTKAVLAFGQPMRIHQLRAGVGVRF